MYPVTADSYVADLPTPPWTSTWYKRNCCLDGMNECILFRDSPNSPTSWFWNIRVGDKIQINNAGPWYTVVGPMAD